MIVFSPQYLNNTGSKKKKTKKTHKDLADFQLEGKEKHRTAFMHFMGEIA